MQDPNTVPAGGFLAKQDPLAVPGPDRVVARFDSRGMRRGIAPTRGNQPQLKVDECARGTTGKRNLPPVRRPARIRRLHPGREQNIARPVNSAPVQFGPWERDVRQPLAVGGTVDLLPGKPAEEWNPPPGLAVIAHGFAP